MNDTIPKCKCGTGMSELRNGVFACENCDSTQVGEGMTSPRPRVRTPQDIRFDMSWLAEMTVEYGPLPADVSLDDLYRGTA